MSYLPDLRASLVKAARREAQRDPADGRPQSDSGSRIPARFRRRGGGIAAFIAAAAALAIMVIALAGLGHRHAVGDGASPPSGPSPAKLRAAAQAAATGLLARLVLPPGAARTASDPSSPPRLGSPEDKLAIANSVDVHRFWRLPGSIRQAANWFQSHPPAGGQLRSSQESGAGPAQEQAGSRSLTVLDMWGGMYVFSNFPAGITAQELTVELSAAKGGGVAVRADGQAVALPPRPLAQQLPPGTARVRVRVRIVPATATPGRSAVRPRGRSRFQLRPRTYDITSRRRIEELVAFMNLLPSAAPAQAPCGNNPPPADKRPNATLAIGLTFYGASASAPLAAADFGSFCDVVRLTIGNRPEQDLISNFPGVQASRYEFLIRGLVTDFATLPGAAGDPASAGASASAVRQRRPARAR